MYIMYVRYVRIHLYSHACIYQVMGFIFGVVMLFWIWDRGVPRRQKLGIMCGIGANLTVSICMYVHLCVCMYVCMYGRMAWNHVGDQAQSDCEYMYVCAFICNMHMCNYLYVCMAGWLGIMCGISENLTLSMCMYVHSCVCMYEWMAWNHVWTSANLTVSICE